MAKSKLQIALPKIAKFFKKQKTSIFKHKELAEFFSNNRDAWELSRSASLRKFITFLTENGHLMQLDFPFPYRSEVRYVWGGASILEILLTLKANSYFTHQTALYFHGLTTTEPNNIYLNFEQTERPSGSGLEQKSIDAAFRSPARQSNNRIDFNGKRIFMVNGKNTEQLGVIDKTVVYEEMEVSIKLTDIERTLIDATVRPIYAGGTAIVQKAYELAKDRVSIPKLIATLNKLRYLYPYHQAIGYYLEKAGYDEQSIKLFEVMPKEYDFYLCNQIKNASYVDKWKLYVPKP